MRFSIVTPAFNAARYLPEMLASLRSQSFTDWELRIVDDCSTDSTLEIIRKAALSDPRIKVIALTENSGSCFYPRRRAIESAEGDYVVNIDADDTVEPDYLLNLDQKICQSGADIVYADMYVGGKKILPDTDIDPDKVFSGKEIFRQTLNSWKIAGIGATSRELALRSLTLFNLEFGDTSYWGGFHDENLTRLDIFLARKVAFAPAGYFYRTVDGSITHAVNAGRFELLNADINLRDFAGRHFGSDSDEYAMANAQLFHHVVEFMRLLNKHPEVNTQEIVATVRSAFRAIDFKRARGWVSPRYLALMRMGYSVARTFLKVYSGEKGNSK